MVHNEYACQNTQRFSRAQGSYAFELSKACLVAGVILVILIGFIVRTIILISRLRASQAEQLVAIEAASLFLGPLCCIVFSVLLFIYLRRLANYFFRMCPRILTISPTGIDVIFQSGSRSIPWESIQHIVKRNISIQILYTSNGEPASLAIERIVFGKRNMLEVEILLREQNNYTSDPQEVLAILDKWVKG